MKNIKIILSVFITIYLVLLIMYIGLINYTHNKDLLFLGFISFIFNLNECFLSLDLKKIIHIFVSNVILGLSILIVGNYNSFISADLITKFQNLMFYFFEFLIIPHWIIPIIHLIFRLLKIKENMCSKGKIK